MSSPSQAFTGWVLPPGAGLQLVSVTQLAAVQNATIGGLDGDADGFYFIVGQLTVGSIGPSVEVTFSPNGTLTNIFPVVNGYTDDGATPQRPPGGPVRWPILGPQSIISGGQVMFQGVIGASSTLYPNSARTWSGSSITQTFGFPPVQQVTTANLGGIWTEPSVGNNLTSLVFDAQPSFTATMTGEIRLYKFG